MPSRPNDNGELRGLTAQDLRALCRPVSANNAPPGRGENSTRHAHGCAHCSHLMCSGWESTNAPLGAPLLERLGTLRDASVDEPTLTEHHPNGTGYWSAQAPIAVNRFPFNRCEVWRCAACQRGFLQYTEVGGYYVDHRVREINPELLISA
jgi:hypothetical protein